MSMNLEAIVANAIAQGVNARIASTLDSLLGAQPAPAPAMQVPAGYVLVPAAQTPAPASMHTHHVPGAYEAFQPAPAAARTAQDASKARKLAAARSERKAKPGKPHPVAAAPCPLGSLAAGTAWAYTTGSGNECERVRDGAGVETLSDGSRQLVLPVAPAMGVGAPGCVTVPLTREGLGLAIDHLLAMCDALDGALSAIEQADKARKANAAAGPAAPQA